ncbi:Gamma-aminobutyric acid receptor subunit pi [Varanus komodoensis]|nr:Gamma-aminobutyric acid receptor subunit pi [Varanus komodoensis]
MEESEYKEYSDQQYLQNKECLPSASTEPPLVEGGRRSCWDQNSQLASARSSPTELEGTRKIKNEACENMRGLQVQDVVWKISPHTETTNSKDYTATIYLRQHWTDPRLVFLGNKSFTLDARLVKYLWVPDTYIVESKRSFLHEVTVENRLIRLFSNGTVLYALRGNDSVHGLDNLQLSQYRVEHFYTHITTSHQETGNYSRLILQFELKRNMLYFILETYMPSSLLVILSWVSFWITLDSVPARTCIGVTTVLSMTTLMMGSRSSVTKTNSFIKAIDIYLGICFSFVFGALVEYVVAHYIASQKCVANETPKMKPLVVTVVLVALMQVSQTFPTWYQKGWLRLLREGESCGACNLELCSVPTNCRAGTVLDLCGCCSECGNVEGQICDLDKGSNFYGHCGDNLECRLDIDAIKFGEIPEPQCVCKSQVNVCGPEGKTYENICQFNEFAAEKGTNISIKHKGPCRSAPVISLPPQDTQNFTGNDIIFGCEVSAYPMPHLEWKKKGNKMFLPGDDSHISIQVRGGPRKYSVTGWLQIEGIKKSDEGVYICQTKNKYGFAYSSATLKVIDGSSSLQSISGSWTTRDSTDYGNYFDLTEEEEEEEAEYESGDYGK